MDTLICDNCGQIIGDDLYCITRNNKHFCTDCCQVCNCCGEIILDSDFITTEDGEIICQDCYDSGYFTCDECGCVCSADCCTTINNIAMCSSCIQENTFVCDDCNGISLNDDGHSVNYDRTVCDCCYDDYCWCENCNNYIHLDDMHDASICNSCFDEEDSDNFAPNVNDYYYKPIPVFMSETQISDSDLYLGVELEVDYGHNRGCCTDDIYDSCEDIYMKEDGSLGDSGFEIVSHPATLGYHKNCLPWIQIMGICKNYDYEAADSCGLHVHASRKFFGDNQTEQDLNIAKAIMLVSRFWEHIRVFSRRDYGKLTHWARNGVEFSIDETDSETDICQKLITKRDSDGRYVAVNLTNISTIEFRVFASTLNPDTLFATLEFVDAICRFAKRIDITDVDTCTWTQICEGEDYLNLKNENAYYELV